MEVIEVTTEPITSHPDVLDELMPYLGPAVAAFSTIVILVILKTVIYLCLTRNANVMSLLRRQPHDVTSRTEAGNVTMTSQSCPQNNLEWYLSDVPGDVVVYVVQLGLAIYSLHWTTLTEEPFVGENSFLAVETFLFLATANIAYRLVTSFLKPSCKCGFKISALHNTIALAMYISILVTRQDAILGVVAMLSQFCLLFTSINRVVRHRYTDQQERLNSQLCSYVLRVCAIALFGIAIPTVYIALAMATQKLDLMNYYSMGVLIVSTLFFGISNLMTLKEATMSCCLRVQNSGDLDTRSHSNETSRLLGQQRPRARVVLVVENKQKDGDPKQWSLP